jgi:heme-degrading monooxygenase HmoA
MYIVIFRAQVQTLDAEYSAMANQLRRLALDHYGCLAFAAVSEGDCEIALSYWPDENAICNWKQACEHLLAQQYGRERWYRAYSVEIAQINRRYAFNLTD